MRSPSYEQALQKSGINFEYVEGIELDEINHTRGKQLQARLQPLDLDLIDRYRDMLTDGFEPPPLLLWRPGRGLYVPLDGNQRIEAARTAPKKHQPKFSAYVVTVDDQMVIDRLCWQFNNLVNGRRLSYEETLEHALSFCRKYDLPPAQTARDWGVKVWELQVKLKESKLRDLASSNRLDLSTVPARAVQTLAPLERLGEDVFVKAAKLVKETGLGQDGVEVLVRSVADARTHDKKIEAIDSFAQSDVAIQSKAITKGGRIRKPRFGSPRDRLHRQMDMLDKLLTEFQEEVFRPVKSDRDERTETATRIVNKFTAIYGLGAFVNGKAGA